MPKTQKENETMAKIKNVATKKTTDHVVIINGEEKTITTECKTFGSPVIGEDDNLVGNCTKCNDSIACMAQLENSKEVIDANKVLLAEETAKKAEAEMEAMEKKMVEMQAAMEQAKANKAAALLIVNQKKIRDLEEELRIAMIPVNAIKEKLSALDPKRRNKPAKRTVRSKKSKPYHEILDMVKDGVDKQKAILAMVDMGFKVTVSSVFCDRVYWLHGIATGQNVKDSNAKRILDYELHGIGAIPDGLDPSTVSAYVNFAQEYKAWANK